MTDSIEMLMLKVEHRFHAIEDRMVALEDEFRIIMKSLETIQHELNKGKCPTTHKEEHARNNVKVIRFNLSELEKYLGFKD